MARADYGGAPADWIGFSTGINPWPYSLPAIPPEAWTQLPQPDAEERLLAAARKAYGVPVGDRIAAGTLLFRLMEMPVPAEEWHDHLARAHNWTRPFVEHAGWLRFGLPGTTEAQGWLEAALLSPAAPAAT